MTSEPDDDLAGDAGAPDEISPARLVAFSDGVFAIAITLLAFQLRVPDLPAGREGELWSALRADGPRFAAFVTTFLVVGVYWRGHHRLFHHIRRVDGRLIWLNLLVLLGVAAMPFASAMVGRYGDEPVALAVYAGTLAAVGLANALLWAYASRGRRLVERDLALSLARAHLLRSLVPATAFLASVPFAYWSPVATRTVWLLGLALYFVVELVRN